MVAEKKIYHDSSDHVSLQDDADDALSLSDLPIYEDLKSDEWSAEHGHGGLCNNSTDEDFFEFSSHQYFASSSQSSSLNQNIVFCGKIIPCRQPDVFITTGKPPYNPRKQKGRMSRWRSLLLRLGILSNHRSSADKYGKTLHQNNRWYLFVFGLGRFPVEMELRDIKTRQSRLLKADKGSPTSSSPSPVYAYGISEKKSCKRRPDDQKAYRIGCMPLIL